MHRNPLTDAPVVLQLDEIPIITPCPVVGEIAHPDGAAGDGPRDVVALGVPGGRVLGEDVAEKGLEDGHAAADEAGVDFDDAGRRGGG